MEIVIIGGIAAGMSAAAKAHRVNPDAKITVIEMEDYISFGACGLPYYLGGQFDDKKLLFARSVAEMPMKILVRHKVVSVDFKTRLVTIKNLDDGRLFDMSYDRLMIATGARAILPPLEHIDADNVYTITKLDRVHSLKSNLDKYRTIAIVGGGFIGCEVAEQLALMGKEVHLIQSPKHLMNHPFDPEFSEKIEGALREVGVSIHTEERAKSLQTSEDLVTHVETNKFTYPVDALIVAVGFKPNTEFLDGQLDTLDNGAIRIDMYGETSITDVFACGDCASIVHKFLGDRYIPLATYANKMGRIIGSNIVSERVDWLSYSGALGTSAIKVGHHEAVVTGLTQADALKFGFDVKTSLVEVNNHPAYYPNQHKIMIKLVYDAATNVVYGAQMFGKGETVLRATGLTTAIHAGLTTEELGYIDYAYSPPFSSTWEALNVAGNSAK